MVCSEDTGKNALANTSIGGYNVVVAIVNGLSCWLQSFDVTSMYRYKNVQPLLTLLCFVEIYSTDGVVARQQSNRSAQTIILSCVRASTATCLHTPCSGYHIVANTAMMYWRGEMEKERERDGEG